MREGGSVVASVLLKPAGRGGCNERRQFDGMSTIVHGRAFLLLSLSWRTFCSFSSLQSLLSSRCTFVVCSRRPWRRPPSEFLSIFGYSSFFELCHFLCCYPFFCHFLCCYPFFLRTRLSLSTPLSLSPRCAWARCLSV